MVDSVFRSAEQFRRRPPSFWNRGQTRYAESSPACGGTLQRVCFLLNVRPDKLEEYKARHREVWPDMIRALRESGWSNYSLFLRPDGLLVGYLETADFGKALAEMTRRAVNEQWQREMAPYFLSQNDKSRFDEAMVPLEEIFHLDS